MKPTTTVSPLAAALTATVKPEFKIVGETLYIHNVVSTDLDAYRWYAPGQIPVSFVFVANEVHIITLDDDEQEFTQVCSLNQTVDVTTVTDEEVVMYAEEADRVLAQRQTARA
jgi:hypothetical protein